VRNDCGRRRQGARHGQAAGAAIIDADFALGAFGGGIRAAAMAENAAGLRESFGGNLGGAKACYETGKRNRISRGKRDDAARQ
jgi:hypothetical protein